MSSLLANKSKQYRQLIKPIQTGFLLATGFTGLISTGATDLSWDIYFSLICSQFFTISGSMILNTVYDRDFNLK